MNADGLEEKLLDELGSSRCCQCVLSECYVLVDSARDAPLFPFLGSHAERADCFDPTSDQSRYFETELSCPISR